VCCVGNACGNTERAHGQIPPVFGASGGITYECVARETEKRLVGVLDSVGYFFWTK
jgi:hypothetical protein